MNKIKELLQEGSVVVDVRTPSEFMRGHVAGSINIPLDELPLRLNEVRNKKAIILCCASGMRSGNAAAFLKQHGIDCYNAGPWTEVNYYTNN
ncbi:MAG: rhodanese-like protein [Flavipsychrobacter sp.]|jgi:rhodanese-related sulfurtransferase|nr:rhodanese-like protein [Flavipsychrobacter sp.]